MSGQIITEACKANFETLKRAMIHGDVDLMVCKDRLHGHSVVAICAVNTAGQECEFIPIAKMLDGNPYAELISPMEEGGIPC